MKNRDSRPAGRVSLEHASSRGQQPKPEAAQNPAENDAEKLVLDALRQMREGVLEIRVQDARIVQIERDEKEPHTSKKTTRLFYHQSPPPTPMN